MVNNKKRKIQVKPPTPKKQKYSTPAKKPKYYCEYCEREYKNYGCLSTHYTKKHEGQFNKCSDDPKLLFNRMNNHDKEAFARKQECLAMKNDLEECLTLKNDFKNFKTDLKKLLHFKKAELGLARDRDIDRKKGRYLRFFGFKRNFFEQKSGETKQLKQIVEDQMEQFIMFKIHSTLQFRIVKAIPKFLSTSVSVTIQFSEDTDVHNLFRQLMIFIDSDDNIDSDDENENKQYQVQELFSPGTLIRMSILSAIGKKITSEETGKNYKVYFKEDYKLYFSVKQNLTKKDTKDLEFDGEEVRFNDKFINAIERYGSKMKSEDYSDAKHLCKLHNIKGEDLHQFLVELD